MKEEPKIKFNLNSLSNEQNLFNTQNDFKIKEEIKSISSNNNTEKFNERNFNNLFESKSLTSSVPSNILLTPNNTSLNEIQKNINHLKEFIPDINNKINNEAQNNNNDLFSSNDLLKQNSIKILNLKQLVYHKKSVRNFSNINNKDKLKQSKINNTNNRVQVNNTNNRVQGKIINNQYDIKIKRNEKMKEFKDLTLSEYLKKEIQNMKSYQNKNSRDENVIFEEKKFNILEVNKRESEDYINNKKKSEENNINQQKIQNH